MQHWLMKTEPDTFGIDDLERVKTEPWTGVRNYQARNFMRDQMQVGDGVLFYHSSCAPPGVAGLARVARTGVVDATQFDPASPYFDPTSTRAEPRWVCVEVAFAQRLAQLISLERLRANPALDGMLLFQRGMRLSVQPVSAAHYAAVVAMIGPGAPATKAGRPAARREPRPQPVPAAKARAPVAKPVARSARKPAAR